MQSGMDAFNGNRLKEAREARGLSRTALSDLIGVHRSGIARYENGETPPSSQVVSRMAEILRMPHLFFFKPGGPQMTDVLFYRSMSSNTKADRLRAEQKYNWMKQVTSYVRGFVRTPPTNLPDVEPPHNPLDIDQDFIESAAMSAREQWGLGGGPISDIMLLMENNGIVVSRISVDSLAMDGYSSIDSYSGYPYVVLASDKDAAVRSRFDLAHELGHLLLHSQLPSGFIRNPVNNKLVEEQAHSFAGAFLMPEETFAGDLWVITLDALRDLKPKWLVSIGAMLYRVGQLGWITDEQRRGLWINYSRRGWKRKEPLDDSLEVERPRLLCRSIRLIVEKGGISPSRIVSDICLHPSDICEIAGLDDGYLSDGIDLDISLDGPMVPDLGDTESYRIAPGRMNNVN